MRIQRHPAPRYYPKRFLALVLSLGSTLSGLAGEPTVKAAVSLASEEVAQEKGFGMGPPARPETVVEAARQAAARASGPVEANWDSVKAHYTTPDWFRDAKFGIFLHWGLYSVPGYGSEWYEKHMYGNPGIAKWHAAHFGEQDTFGYKDLIPLFTCDKFDADEWAALFQEAGARYVIPSAEHHDGWALWDSALTTWDSMDRGPHRDLIGELAKATRQHGMKFGVSNHRIEHYTFIQPLPGLKTDVDDPANDDFYWHANHSESRVRSFLSDWVARNVELIDKYQPDMIYYDNGVNHRIYDPVKLQVAAYYYNRALQWGKQVSFATKSEAFLAGTVKDYERQSRAPLNLQQEVFQVDDSVHQRWGYLKDAKYWKVETIIQHLIENVCRNGNLLLNFSPRADGTIPEEQKALLRGIGAWLKVNGEAIYETRPWILEGEGRLVLGKDQTYTSKDIRFTTHGATLYAITLAWPESGELHIQSLASNLVTAPKIRTIEMLGAPGVLEFQQDESGLRVKLPAKRPCETAYCLRLSR